GLVKFSRGALVKMKGLSKFTSPKKLLSGEENVNPSTFLKYFGEKVGEEVGEEMVENTAGKINPVLEFLVSVANSADGVDAKLSMHGIKGANIGVTTEGRSMVYTTKTPQKFVANLKTELDVKPGVEYKATINSDNSVTLDILSMDIDPATGAKKQRISTTIKIHPAQLSTNISSDVEITRIQGLQATKGKPGEYTFTDSEHSMSVFANLYSRGFNITKQSDNSFKVSKGDTVFTLKASDSVIGTNRAKLATWITNPAFKKFLELNGNYRKLLKKYPKLAKLFPKDLLKLKVIPVPVMALACGLPMNLKSIQELALGTPKTSAQLGSLVTESNLVNSSTTEQTLDLIGIKSNRELIRTTYFDSATGLMNRNGLILGEKLLRQGGTLSIANFDADHFRASNEMISRSYGDAQIQIIAKNINHAILKLRKAGYKAYAIRMGGEEFTIMTTAPKEILHKTVVEMSANAKKEVLSTLSEEQKKVMSEHIAKTKYADDPNGIAKARSELGGISGSIIRIDGKALDHQKSDIKKALMYADSSMEGLKRINGRGHFDLDHRSSKETSQRVNTFEIDNVLDSAQKTNLGKEAKRLFSRATNQFNSRLNLLNSVIKKSSPSEQKTFFKELKYVLSSPDSRIQEIANVLKKYGANPSIAQKLKTEYITALKSYGTYTGARTMQSYLSKTGKIFPRFREANGWKIEIGKFKSINETLGHVGGDAFLTFVYQDVIIPTTKKMGIRVEGSNPDLIISQKGADFYFCFSNKFLLHHPGIETQFQNAMNKQYKTSYHSFITRITGNGKSYQAKRDKWLGDNEQSNPNSLIEQYNLYFHKT
ncbi:GGDEF domain-containing protein, partial [bacterium]|nr:GGDEF domain-containing protein [bacterium]